MFATGRLLPILCALTSGCATIGYQEENFSPAYIIDFGEGRMSNTKAVQDCERRRPPEDCNELRSEEIDRIVEYLEDAYESTPSRNLAGMMLVSEGFSILLARMNRVAFEPAGGRPFRSIGNVPPLRSERLAREAAQSQATSDLLGAIGGVASGVAAASSAGVASGGLMSGGGGGTVGGGMGGSPTTVFEGTGNRSGSRNCAPDIVDAGGGRSPQDC